MKKVVLLLGVLAVTAPGVVFASCVISGTMSAQLNSVQPSLGNWAYTLQVSWNTGGQHALSHFDLVLDSPGGTCSCSDFASSLAWADPAGSSDGNPGGCRAYYAASLGCHGDPSIPGNEGIVLKFEPTGDCHPGPTGTGTFVFYSDFPPAAISSGGSRLIQKFATQSCSGDVTGVFPGFACDSVSNEGATWGTVKALYHQ